MADVPKDLLDEIKKLEQLLTVDTAKLKQITKHFVSELDKGMSSVSYTYVKYQDTNCSPGLSVGGGSIVSHGFPRLT